MANTQGFKVHTTFPSLEEDMKNKTALIPLSYSHNEVQKVLMKNAAQPVRSKISEAQYQLLKQGLDPESSKTLSPQEFKDILEAAFNVLDDLFYFGLLKSLVDLDVQLEDGPPKTAPWGVIALTTQFLTDLTSQASVTPEKLCPDGQKPRIEMFLFRNAKWDCNKCPKEFYRKDLHKWMCTLLHEMLHAFFNIFSCACWKKCLDETLDPVRGLGNTGHGLKFCESLEAMHVPFRREFGVNTYQFFGEEFHWGAHIGALGEICETGWEPLDSQLEEWGLERSEAEESRARWRDWKDGGFEALVVRKLSRAAWLRLNDTEHVKYNFINPTPEEQARIPKFNVSYTNKKLPSDQQLLTYLDAVGIDTQLSDELIHLTVEEAATIPGFNLDYDDNALPASQQLLNRLHSVGIQLPDELTKFFVTE